MIHLTAENHDLITRQRLLARFRAYFDNGFRDPELLYLGSRYAISLGIVPEAYRFLNVLTEMMSRPAGDAPSPTLAPLGLLYEQIPPSDQADENKNRTEAIAHLYRLAEQNSTVKEFLDEDQIGLGTPSLSETTKAAISKQFSPNETKSNIQAIEIQQLAAEATEAYNANDIKKAKYALEQLLLLNGDQPDVLRNLISIASELQDIESYERYWRRYVKVLLWRIMRGDEVAAAWDDLVRFYAKVAKTMNREFNKPLKVQELLSRPGFLPRWLEAHVGLIWLESVFKSRRVLQTNLENPQFQDGKQGHLALMHYWFHLFYPQFQPYLEIGKSNSFSRAFIMPTPEIEIQLAFNPTITLVKHFLEWSKFNFALVVENEQFVKDRHSETIVAIAGCVARIPIRHYPKALADTLPDDDRNGLELKTITQQIQETCSLLFSQFSLNTFLEAEDWEGLASFFGEPDIEDKLTAPIRMFLALAQCRSEEEFKGLELACRTLPDLPSETLQKDQQNYNLWRGVLNLNIRKALDASTKPTAELRANLEQRAEADYSQIGRKGAKLMFEGLLTADPDSAAEAWINIVKCQVMTISSQNDLGKLKKEAIDEIDGVFLQQFVLRKVFDEAKELVAQSKFQKARDVINKIPDTNKDISELVENFLSQIDDAENSFNLNQKIEDAIEQSKKHAEVGNFFLARRVIQDLPNSPSNVQQLKQQLLSQIDEAETSSKQQELLNQTIEVTKVHVQKGEFNQARRTIQALPNNPAEMAQFKKQFLDQINDAEQQYQIMQRDIQNLTNQLARRGISGSQISKIALDNNININNPADHYGLLKAIDRQL